MDTRTALAELDAVARALRAHLEWQAELGAGGLAACGAGLLDERRQRYRELARVDTPEPAPSIDAESEAAPRVGGPLASSPATRDVTETPRVAASPEYRPTPAQRPEPQKPQRVQPRPEPQHAEPQHSEPQRTEPRSEPPPSSASTEPASVETGASGTTSKPAARPWSDVLPPLVFGEDRLRRLALLEREVRDCTRCGLHQTRTNTVFSRGSGKSGICFVGEGPGADEDAQGLPFVGSAGQLLDKMIAAMGFARDDVYVCNIVKCRPPKNRKPEPPEMTACRDYLAEQLELIQPRVIVALGATAVQGLLGLSLGITRLRGHWRSYRGEIPVMPTFHPAYLLRQPSAKREVWEDLQQVLTHLGLSTPPRS